MSIRTFGEERCWTSSADRAIRSQLRFYMPRTIIGVMVTLILSCLWVPTLAASESPGRLPRIGLLIPGSGPFAGPQSERLEKTLGMAGLRLFRSVQRERTGIGVIGEKAD